MNRSILIAAIALLVGSLACATDKHHGQPVTPTPEVTRSDQGFSRNGYGEHFAVSALAGIVVSAHIEKDSPVKAWAYAMAPGLLKEVIDWQTPGNRFSSRDMLANAIGAAVGVGVGRALLLRHRDGQTQVALVLQMP